MKKEQICIYKDETFEKEVVNTLPVAQSALQVLVDQFNQVTRKIPAKNLTDVAPGELSVLVSNPRQLFDERCLSIEVPQGLKRDAYLNMVDLPSLDSLMASHQAFIKIGYTDPGLYELEAGQVHINESEVTQLAQAQRIYIDRDSREYEIYTELNQLAVLLNKYSEILPVSLVSSRFDSPFNQIFDNRQVPGTYSRYKYVFSVEKLRDIMNRQRITAL